MSDSLPTLLTKAALARESGVDPRNKALSDLEPVAQVKLSGNKLVPLYDRNKAIADLAARLMAASRSK
jgi:hypothetical protein